MVTIIPKPSARNPFPNRRLSNSCRLSPSVSFTLPRTHPCVVLFFSRASGRMSVNCSSESVFLQIDFQGSKSADENESAERLKGPFRSKVCQVQMTVDENESEERLVGRFRSQVLKAGVLQEAKRRRRFESKQDKRKRKT